MSMGHQTPTQQGCSGFTVSLQTQRSGNMVIQSRSPCTFTLFSSTCFSSSTWWTGRQMRDHSLSPGLYTQVASHTEQHTHAHLKVVEGDAWLWRCEGTDRDFDCSYPTRSLFLLFGSVPLIMCVCVCIHVCSCQCAPLLTQHVLHTLQAMCCGGKCLA